jgi:hypothetical protein
MRRFGTVFPEGQTPRAYLVYRQDVCAFVNRHGRVVYCKRDGTLIPKPPKGVRRDPLEPDDLPESAWEPQETPASH